MMDCGAPFLIAPPQVAAAAAEACAVRDPVSYLEEMVLSGRIETLPLFLTEHWLRFRTEVCQIFEENDYAAIRGFPSDQDGAALLLAALTIGESLRIYRDGKVSKHFKMSPWTTELSHTIRAGEFHTDLNTEPYPPAITAIQCLDPDPGSPQYGIIRVARLTHLLNFVSLDNDKSTQRFLKEDTVTMLNDRSLLSRTGPIVEADVIRYHPETIRAAGRRSGESLRDLEQRIAGVERAAMSVSNPFALQRGDILLISNHRTLHCRGECSVIFRDYPMDFCSRRVSVLHATRERQGQ